jgi:hemoglobin
MTVNSNLGICGVCTHAKIIAAKNAAEYLRCSLHDQNPATFTKYPSLPLIACDGFSEHSKKTLSSAEQAALPQSLLQAIGGRPVVRKFVEAFYTRASEDELIGHLFGEDLKASQAKQSLFMEQWLGGEPVYSQIWGHPRLRIRHFPFVIGPAHSERWLELMEKALLESSVTVKLVNKIMARLKPLAKHMINIDDNVPREPRAKKWMD